MKIKTDIITDADLEAYLKTQSDFGFELQILKDLKERGFHTEHGGHYDDPVTMKSREFDIRAVSEHGADMRIGLAIECKNIKPHFPLIVSATPREGFESYVSFISDSKFNKSRPVEDIVGRLDVRAITDLTTQPCSHTMCDIYPVGGMVGRSTAQVGRNSQGDFVANDSEIYEKWGQAISSLHKVINWLTRRDVGDNGSAVELLGAALPFVVVPDGMLWLAEYSEDGTLVSGPNQVDRIFCVCGKKYSYGSPFKWDYQISHLEFVTQRGLLEFIEAFLKDDKTVNSTFFASKMRLDDYRK
jgi:hypothetical protein